MAERDAGACSLAQLASSTTGPLVLDFWAAWCSPCAAYEPVVEDVVSALGNRVTLVRVDLVQRPDLAAECGVATVPALVVVRDGAVARRIFGARPTGVLAVLLGRAIA